MSAWRPAAGRQTGRGDGGAGGDLALALGLALVLMFCPESLLTPPLALALVPGLSLVRRTASLRVHGLARQQ